jgi:hypothetical protein
MKLKLHWSAIFVGLLAMLISTVAMFAVGDLDIDWNSWSPATSMMPDGGFNFNEMVNPNATIRQPWNTFSSLYYVFVGAFLICLPYTEKTKELAITSSKVLRSLFGVSIIITGLGSAFMHMSMTFIGQFFDVVGMYLISVFIVMYAFRNLPKYSVKLFAPLYIVINGALIWSLIYAPTLRRNLFLALILLGLVLEYFCNRKQNGYTPDMLLAAASSLALAYIIWQLDNHRGMFFPQTGFLQGHALWHLGGAIACGLIYLHYSKNYRAAHLQ